MPEYSFQCEQCDILVDIFMSLQGYDSNQKCPHCQAKLIRDYQADNVVGQVTKHTLQALAEKNSAKFSEEQKRDLHKKHYAYRNCPKRDLPDGMSRITPESLSNEKPNPNRRRKPKPKSK